MKTHLITSSQHHPLFEMIEVQKSAIEKILGFLVFLILSLSAQPIYPQIFKCKKDNSSISYQEKPCQSGEIDLNIKSQHNKQYQPHKPTPDQKKYCTSVGKYAEAVVDLYISGLNKAQALDLLNKEGRLTDKTRKLQAQTTIFVYDEIGTIGNIRNENIRKMTKENMNMQAEINCLKLIATQ